MRWCVIPEDIILVFLAERKEKSEYMHKYVSIRFFVFGFVFFVSLFFVFFFLSFFFFFLLYCKKKNQK